MGFKRLTFPNRPRIEIRRSAPLALMYIEDRRCHGGPTFATMIELGHGHESNAPELPQEIEMRCGKDLTAATFFQNEQ